ncbi:hypothetical protein PULV_a2442 [Pseudoalteromonas ulvae UL12]|nr:hypothetical protein [Pseudoalteromonas ulvae UL12]
MVGHAALLYQNVLNEHSRAHYRVFHNNEIKIYHLALKRYSY